MSIMQEQSSTKRAFFEPLWNQGVALCDVVKPGDQDNVRKTNTGRVSAISRAIA